jgi:exonuclease SbcC
VQLNDQLQAKNDQIESAQIIHGILEKAVYREELTLRLADDRAKLLLFCFYTSLHHSKAINL